MNETVRPGLTAQLGQVVAYHRTHRLGETLAFLASKDAPFIVQFAKYGFCGGIAFITQNVIAYWLSKTYFPAFDGLPVAVLKQNQIYANLVALAASNLVAYITNVLWVFTGGRHSRLVEFLIFSAVNVVSGTAGILAGPWLRDVIGTNWWVAQASLIVTSTLVNFVCRKFFVFAK